MTTTGEHHVPTERAYHDGYFIVEDLITAEACSQFADRLQRYARGDIDPPEGVGLQREPGLTATGEERSDGGDIRKVSGLYADDAFASLIGSDGVTSRMTALVGRPLRLFRADALMKPPMVGSEKGVHQDSPYWPIHPMSLWSCWMPFDDATVDNGCMMIIPGSHATGPRPHTQADGDYVLPPEQYDLERLQPVEMRRGTGLFFHSLLIHATAANTSGNPRRAVTMSYMGPEHQYTGDGTAPYYPVVGSSPGLYFNGVTPEV